MDDEDGRRCISANIIRQTRIVNDATILFYVSGSDIYRNDLPRSCPGLAREGRFSYRRSTSSLCRNDSIQVLMAGAGSFREGPSCGLGNFFKMTKEDVDLLLNPGDTTPPPQPPPPSEPEEVVPQDSDEETGAA